MYIYVKMNCKELASMLLGPGTLQNLQVRQEAGGSEELMIWFLSKRWQACDKVSVCAARQLNTQTISFNRV